MPKGAGVEALPIAMEQIELRMLEVKPAWQVSEDDPLFTMILQPDDDPYVPSEVPNPQELAVYRLLAARGKRRQK
jgi:hypothetical protein